MHAEIDPRTETAYHEAGHVVAARACGLVVLSASVVEAGDCLGLVKHPSVLGGYTYDGKREYRRLLREHAITWYAGGEAVRRLCPGREPAGIDDDEAQAFDIMREYPIRGCSVVGDDVYLAYLDKLRVEARRLVTQHWPKVERIAGALLEHGTLTAEEIERLLS